MNYCSECDDLTLLNSYNEKMKVFLETESQLKKHLERDYRFSYLNIVIAKLSYGFAKEELEAAFSEIKKRGIITV